MHRLLTWAGRSSFSYTGSVAEGTKIRFGRTGQVICVSKDQYDALRKAFLNQTVPIGTSRTSPPSGSLGEWLQNNVTQTAIASYVGPILISEGFAVKADRHEITIKK